MVPVCQALLVQMVALQVLDRLVRVVSGLLLLIGHLLWQQVLVWMV